MTTPYSLQDRFALTFVAETFRREIAGLDVIIHCHHYNSRVQRTVENAAAIDGRGIFVSCAEAVFANHLRHAIRSEDSVEEAQQIGTDLYSHLGYGRLDLSDIGKGKVRGTSSHFVEGWRAGFAKPDRPVCSLTEGYLQALIAVTQGQLVHVKETRCMIQGADCCEFEVCTDRTEPLESYEKNASDAAAMSSARPECITSPNVDEQAIVNAVAGMPIHGNAEGLIPAFNVYLANTPADFYNLLAVRFVEAMDRAGLGEAARTQLTNDAEACAMNTFRGIMSSAEWDALIAPMIKQPSDNLYGILAVSNALGWGDWHVVSHEPEETLSLASANGYEALGYAELRGKATRPQCYMLQGVAAGMMELIYGEGSLEDRFGQFASNEDACLCHQGQHCCFNVESVA